MKNIAKKLVLSILLVSLVLATASCNLGGLFGGGEQTDTDAPQNSAEQQKDTTPEPAETTSPVELVPPDPENDPDVKQAFCQELTALSANTYTSVVLDIATTVKGTELNSKFVLNEREVEYTIEKLSTFEVDDNGNIVVPESFKNTLTGSVTLGDKNDTVIFDGEILVVSDYDVLCGNFNFVAENVGQYNKADGDTTTVIFEVLDVAGFLGTKIEGIKSMMATVSYSKDAITVITLQYITDSASVEMSYRFS